ncbi:MAG: N-formylglutamate amidohydrolase [Pseudomonadota bacterium]
MRTLRNATLSANPSTAPKTGSQVLTLSGGRIPARLGASDCGPAFTHAAPRSMPLPVLIAVPHAGRAYPDHVLAGFRDEELCQLRLEDRHVDHLGVAIAKATGTGLLVAHAPRAMLDLNRAHDDVDWDMIGGARRRDPVPQMITGKRAGGANRRARSGLGLVPRRLPGFGEIWRAPLPREELDARIDHIHRPYHEFLTRELERIRDAWGTALLLDLHSMPPLRQQPGQARAPQIVLGDRFGASCSGSLLSRAFRYLEASGYEAAHNRPYSGGYVLDRHAAPSRGIHALQIEVCRATYLDDGLSQISQGLKPLADMLAGLARELGAETARLAGSGRLDEAAE